MQCAGGEPRVDDAAGFRRGGIVDGVEACSRPGCGSAIPPQATRRGEAKRYCSDRCRRAHWESLHPRQAVLDFKPEPIRVARPPHNPALVSRLCRAALNVLGLLGDGQPHTRHELAHVGGARYSARVNELREAGHRILGPSKALRLRCAPPIHETEPLGPAGVERYRLEARR